jgi:hypothetical protein
MARAKKVTLNRPSIRKKVGSSKVLLREARAVAKNILEDAKEAYMDEFEKHKITQELEAGPTASNMSGTLGGYGNLFSFMGFSSGSENPISKLRRILWNGFGVKRETPNKKRGGLRTFVFSYPDREYIESKSSLSLRFETGRNWVIALERGISGFSSYMHKKFPAGRSGMGLQIGRTISKGRTRDSYSPTPYRTLFEQKFTKTINKGVSKGKIK